MSRTKPRQCRSRSAIRAAAGLLVWAPALALAQPGAPAASGGGAPAAAASTGTAAGTGSAAGATGPGMGLRTGFGGSDPSPYYIGVSQGFTHESNVFRTPSGRSDTYSSTSLLGGIDQRIGRQRLFGAATVSANRYFNASELNNTSYGLTGGLDWETINKLSGNVNAGFNRNLAAPAVSGVVPQARRNIVQTESLSATVRYGGASLLTLEGMAGYSRVDYSDPTYAPSETRGQTAGLTLFYRPGGPLRLGVGARLTRSETPRALFDPAAGTYQSNTVDGKNLDLIVDYRLSGIVDASGRLSYTRQDNSNPLISGADFSGLTGSLNVTYLATGKTSFNVFASRDAGVTSSAFNGFVVDVSQPTPVRTLQSGVYQNNQLSNAAGVTASYAATGRTSLTTGLRYTRAKLLSTLVTTTGGTASPDTTDVAKVVFIGASYAISYNWGLNCSASHEKRDISGGVAYSYTANSIGCVTQYTWR